MDNLDPNRYTVRVAPGASTVDAIAAHRERTGYGGTVIVVREHAPRAARAAA
jgi:hypothetical protein